jgi:hypothetical protein
VAKLPLEGLALPRIAAGLGGLAWDDVAAVALRRGLVTTLTAAEFNRPHWRTARFAAEAPARIYGTAVARASTGVRLFGGPAL